MPADEHKSAVGAALDHLGTQVFHVGFQRSDGGLAQRHHSLFAAFAQAAAEALAQIEVVYFQTSHFRCPGATGIERFEDGPVPEIELVVSSGTGQQLGNAFVSKHRGQTFPERRTVEQINCGIVSPAFELKEPEEHLEGDEVPGDAGWRELAGFTKMADVLTEVSQAELRVVFLLAGAEPFGKVIEITGVGEQSIIRQSTLGFKVLPEGGDVEVEFFERHGVGARE